MCSQGIHATEARILWLASKIYTWKVGSSRIALCPAVSSDRSTNLDTLETTCRSRKQLPPSYVFLWTNDAHISKFGGCGKFTNGKNCAKSDHHCLAQLTHSSRSLEYPAQTEYGIHLLPLEAASSVTPLLNTRQLGFAHHFVSCHAKTLPYLTLKEIP